MASSHWSRLTLACVLCLLTAAARAADPAVPPAAGAAQQKDDGTLAISGTVRLADGSPAADAIVNLQGINLSSSTPFRADSQGRFQITDRFANGLDLHVQTPDGSQQSVFTLSTPAIRTAASTPVTVELAPADFRSVRIIASGKPVAGAQVCLSGVYAIARATTDDAGQATLQFPKDMLVRSVAAWHPTLGVGGVFNRAGGPPQQSYEIDLLPPASHEIHVVDEDGKPVAGIEFGINVAIGEFEFIVVAPLAPTRARTDEAGVAKVDWVPRDNLRVVSPEYWSDHFKVDTVDHTRVKEGVTTMRLRHKHPLTGRLIVPDGVDPRGIWISGMGFGPGNQLDLTRGRVRADGTFTLSVSKGHGYVLGVLDSQWAADPWLGPLPEPPAEDFQLKLYPATPISVRVTRGADRQPVTNTFVQFSAERRLSFTKESGEKSGARGSLGYWALTDENGVARGSAGTGKLNIGLNAGEWTEQKVVDVKSPELIELEFHRPWIGKRQLKGQLTEAGRPFVPSPAAKLMAWTIVENRMPLDHTPKLANDGTFSLEFDADRATLLFLDASQQRSGTLEIGPEDTSAELILKPTATYAGTLLDDEGQPAAGLELSLSPRENFTAPIITQSTDESGRFKFDAVPVQIPLGIRVRGDATSNRSHYIASNERHFTPGEVRENDEVRLRRSSKAIAKSPPPAIPLATSAANICRDAKLSAMRPLVVLAGDESDATSQLFDQLSEDLSYRVLFVSKKQQAAEAAVLAEHKWPIPADGELVLLILGDDQAVVQSTRLRTTEAAAPVEGRKFLEAHKPAQRDAKSLLAAARQEAKASNRRVWVVSGGPRCGPCFRLSRWMDDHHAVLDKDFVILKIMGGLDEHADEVTQAIPGWDRAGIPYHAITEPDGEILITSSGPLGNIGMPSGEEIEGVRHLRKMLEQTATRITPDEIAGLEKSLLAKP
jgi:hypothetical protein